MAIFDVLVFAIAIQRTLPSITREMLCNADPNRFSTNQQYDYDKLVDIMEVRRNYEYFEENFMSTPWLREFCGLGFATVNPKEKEINSLTQTGD